MNFPIGHPMGKQNQSKDHKSSFDLSFYSKQRYRPNLVPLGWQARQDQLHLAFLSFSGAHHDIER